MAFGVLGLLPNEFYEMTPKEFIDKVTGYGWSLELAAQTRAGSLSTIINTCGNLKPGHRVTTKKLNPGRRNPPLNLFYRQLLGLPY